MEGKRVMEIPIVTELSKEQCEALTADDAVSVTQYVCGTPVCLVKQISTDGHGEQITAYHLDGTLFDNIKCAEAIDELLDFFITDVIYLATVDDPEKTDSLIYIYDILGLDDYNKQTSYVSYNSRCEMLDNLYKHHNLEYVKFMKPLITNIKQVDASTIDTIKQAMQESRKETPSDKRCGIVIAQSHLPFVFGKCENNEAIILTESEGK